MRITSLFLLLLLIILVLLLLLLVVAWLLLYFLATVSCTSSANEGCEDGSISTRGLADVHMEMKAWAQAESSRGGVPRERS